MRNRTGALAAYVVEERVDESRPNGALSSPRCDAVNMDVPPSVQLESIIEGDLVSCREWTGRSSRSDRWISPIDAARTLNPDQLHRRD